jgi:hypothetical protein
MAHERAGTTSITPKAVFCCDGPIDLLNIYAMFKRKHRGTPASPLVVDHRRNELPRRSSGNERLELVTFLYL